MFAMLFDRLALDTKPTARVSPGYDALHEVQEPRLISANCV